MIRKTIIVCAVFLTASVLSAQNIELPEVTTVISGETEKAKRLGRPVELRRQL